MGLTPANAAVAIPEGTLTTALTTPARASPGRSFIRGRNLDDFSASSGTDPSSS
jgi:hypothetical protein